MRRSFSFYAESAPPLSGASRSPAISMSDRETDADHVPSLPRRCRRAAGDERAILARPALCRCAGHGPQTAAQALGGMTNKGSRER
jgi:hypothetical protein